MRPHPAVPGLEALQEKYADRGFTVVGVPVQPVRRPGARLAEEIAEFCSATYGVTFPMTEKVEVNGADRHAVYDELATSPTQEGHTGTSAGTSRSS